MILPPPPAKIPGYALMMLTELGHRTGREIKNFASLFRCCTLRVFRTCRNSAVEFLLSQWHQEY